MEILHFKDLGDTTVVSECSLGDNLVNDNFLYVYTYTYTYTYIHAHAHSHAHIHIYIYIYICSNRAVSMVCMGHSGGDRCFCTYGSR